MDATNKHFEITVSRCFVHGMATLSPSYWEKKGHTDTMCSITRAVKNYNNAYWRLIFFAYMHVISLCCNIFDLAGPGSRSGFVLLVGIKKQDFKVLKYHVPAMCKIWRRNWALIYCSIRPAFRGEKLGQVDGKYVLMGVGLFFRFWPLVLEKGWALKGLFVQLEWPSYFRQDQVWTDDGDIVSTWRNFLNILRRDGPCHMHSSELNNKRFCSTWYPPSDTF